MSYEGEILTGAAALVGVLLSMRGVKVRIEHTLKRNISENEQEDPPTGKKVEDDKPE